jgi:eukaryotic-like serine/threonine-protein kinase
LNFQGASASLCGRLDRILGDFRLLRELGRGGMSVVFEAEQLSLRRIVALKILPAHLTGSDIERFRREAAAAARMRHPNIVSVLAVGEQDGHYFFAMDLVRGDALDRLIQRMREAPSRSHASRMLAEVARRRTDTPRCPAPPRRWSR